MSSFIVWSVDQDKADELMMLNDADFKKALAAAIDFRFGKIVSVTSRQSFPLVMRHIKHYVNQRIVICRRCSAYYSSACWYRF